MPAKTAYFAAATGVSIGIALLPILPLTLILGILALGVLALTTPVVPLVILTAVAPMRVLIATEAPGRFPADVGQIALGVLLVAWLLTHLAKYRQLPRLSFSSLLIPIGAFTFVLALTGISALSITAWLSETVKWAQILLLVILLGDLGQHSKLQWLVFALAAAGIAHALIGLYQFFGGSGALHLLINGRFFRAFGTFGQPNPFGGFMGLLTPVLAMATLGYAWRFWHDSHWTSAMLMLLIAFAAGLTAVGVIMSWSRGAWLGFLASFGVMALLLPRKLWHSTVLFGIGLILGAVLWFGGLVPQPIMARLSTIEFSGIDVRGVEITIANYANTERLAHWQAALRMAEANPLLGVGAGNYELAYERYRLINWEQPLGHAHNYYLNVLAEGGIMGLIVYSAMWFMIFWLNLRARQHPDVFVRCIAVGLLGSWTYLAVHSLTDNLYVNNLFLYIGILLGLLSIIRRQACQYTRLEF